MQIAIALTIIALLGVCKAIQDTLWHHHSTSVFRGNGVGAYWGPAEHAWLRRYVSNNVAFGYVRTLRTPLRRALLIPVWDAWHLMAGFQVALACSLLPVLGLPWWSAIAAFVAHTITFEALYSHLLRRR